MTFRQTYIPDPEDPEFVDPPAPKFINGQTVLVLRVVSGLKCQGCGATKRWVDTKMHLCLYCYGMELGKAGPQLVRKKLEP